MPIGTSLISFLWLQCSKMEDELNVYRNTANLVEAGNRYESITRMKSSLTSLYLLMYLDISIFMSSTDSIIDHLKQSSEPLKGAKNGSVVDNPWAGGADGACIIC